MYMHICSDSLVTTSDPGLNISSPYASWKPPARRTETLSAPQRCSHRGARSVQTGQHIEP